MSNANQTQTENQNDELCFACRTWDRFEHDEASKDDLNRASMWGCTCDPLDAEEAANYINIMTR